jgi:hypothetical protein
MILGTTGPSWVCPEATPACADQAGTRRKESRQVIARGKADRVGVGLGRGHGRLDVTAGPGAPFQDCETQVPCSSVTVVHWQVQPPDSGLQVL